MRNILLTTMMVLALTAMPNKTIAQTTGVGAGLIIGEPTGISAKFWTTSTNALDMGIGWSGGNQLVRIDNGWYYTGPSYLHIHADYLWHSFDAIRSHERFPIYYGFGFHLDEGYSAPSVLGFRGVAGIDWMPHAVPIDVFLELAPVVFLTPGSGLGMDAGIGARFFFK